MNELPTGYGNILVYAARYTYNRSTGAALQVVNAIEGAWDDLSEHDQKQLIRESYNEAVYNRDDWSRIYNKDVDKL